MTQETLKDPRAAEQKLQRVLERYQESPLSTLETFGFFGVGEVAEAADAREQSKEAFLNGDVRNPSLVYPLLEKPESASRFAELEKSALGMMKDIVGLDYEADRETAAYDILRLRYLELFMLQISQRLLPGNTLTKEERQEVVELFAIANDEVHGKLDKALFNGLLQNVYELGNQALQDPNTPQLVREAAGYILENTKLAGPVTKSIDVPPEAIAKLQRLVFNSNADLLSCVPQRGEEETLSLEDLVEMFQAAHQRRDTGWQVVVDEGSAINTRQSDKTTHIGKRRKPVSAAEAAKLVVHENGVHVQRRIEGDKLNDPLLGGTGLAGYLDAEEGLATILEQIMDGKVRESGVQYYLMLGWARGLDGQPRDFRDVYELEWRRRLVKDGLGVNASDELDNIIEKSKQQAYTACVRIFRGTPCDIPGMVYTKDQAYFVGNQKMWEYLIKLSELPEDIRKREFEKLFKAKFDPTNELHRRLVDKASERRLL